jgi:peptidoglycan/xylan/chitin deacetylase (PgdA/CDA1 family)
MAEAGHAIGNHSWDHPSFPFISGSERRRQVRACAEATAPHGQRLFRPPYGEQSVASRLDLRLLGYDVILFSCEVGDWCSPDAEGMGRALTRSVGPGDIVCLHDALYWHQSNALVPTLTAQPHVDRSAMLSALARYLDHASGRMRFVTVPELMKRGRPRRANWYRVTPPSA